MTVATGRTPLNVHESPFEVTPGSVTPPTAALSVNSREYVFHAFRVEVLSGPDAGMSASGASDEVTIGADIGNQLLLTDPAVSRHHCSITPTKLGLLLRDLGSTNGTYVGDVRIEAVYLHSGVQVRVGHTVLRVDMLGDEIREPLSAAESFGPVLGASPAMRRVFALLEKVSRSDTTILLEGETGTGKELVADAIREHSERAGAPFVIIDCGAIPPNLIESELFGHMRGSFTGASADREGAFEAANGGTLFLDEIGELPLEMQPKLLRALENRMVKRIGSSQHVKVDVRIIAATNRDLRAEVNRGSFRADLFYRLNIVRVKIPPLRERREDIALLVSHFYAQLSEDGSMAPPPELITELSRHAWPGNVRELRSAVQRAVILGDPTQWRDPDAMWPGNAVAAANAPVEPQTFDYELPFRVAKERAMATWERSYLTGLVRVNLGNLSRAARAVRMDRNHLRELLRKYGIDKQPANE